MKTFSLTLAIAGSLAFGFVSAAGAAESMAYPDKCKSEMSAAGDMAMQGHQTSGMADFQVEAMDGMKAMNMNMMQGMMKKDADVAFVCGMIAHHMGAISMSETELKHGDNEQAKQMAQKVIDAQKQEIAEMTKWLDTEAQ